MSKQLSENINYSLGSSGIRKLGHRIYESDCLMYKISKEDINHLEAYRKDFLTPLTRIYSIVDKVAKKAHRGNISSFRIKKIETIVSKLKRMKKSEDDHMGLKQIYDIAGCRFVVDSESQLNDLKLLLSKELKNTEDLEFRIKDKTIAFSNDGYKAIHFIVTCKKSNPTRKVEVQLRTKEQHSWATLVEIIDVVFKTKIKEGDQSDPELYKFLQLYSNRSTIGLENASELIDLERQKGIYLKLLNVFKDNIGKVRNIWFFQANSKASYFLFDIVNKEVKSVSTFKDVLEAEKEYFSRFKNNPKHDLMLAKLNAKKFNEFCLAYSNYILVDHNFTEDWINFCADYIEEINKNKTDSKEEIKYVNNLLDIENYNVENELQELNDYIEKATMSDVFKIGDWIISGRRKEARIEAVKEKINSNYKPKSRVNSFLRKVFLVD